MKLEDGFDSSFRMVLVAARRARQLQNGSHPLVDTHSRKACRVAQEEIAAGKVKYVQRDRVREEQDTAQAGDAEGSQPDAIS